MGLKAVLDGVEVDPENILDSKGVVVDFTNLDTEKEDIEFGYCT